MKPGGNSGRIQVTSSARAAGAAIKKQAVWAALSRQSRTVRISPLIVVRSPASWLGGQRCGEIGGLEPAPQRLHPLPPQRLVALNRVEAGDHSPAERLVGTGGIAGDAARRVLDRQADQGRVLSPAEIGGFIGQAEHEIDPVR